MHFFDIFHTIKGGGRLEVSGLFCYTMPVFRKASPVYLDWHSAPCSQSGPGKLLLTHTWRPLKSLKRNVAKSGRQGWIALSLSLYPMTLAFALFHKQPSKYTSILGSEAVQHRRTRQATRDYLLSVMRYKRGKTNRKRGHMNKTNWLLSNCARF